MKTLRGMVIPALAVFVVCLAVSLLYSPRFVLAQRVLYPQAPQGSKVVTPTKPASPTLVAPAPAGQSFPNVVSVSPDDVTQGERVTLTFTGRNMDRVARVSLGAGIQVDLVNVLNAGSVEVAVRVAGDAQPGVRQITVTAGSETKTVTPTVQVLAAAQPTDIIRIDPSTLTQGQSYNLKLAITNAKPRLEVTFGSGVELTSPLAQTGDNAFTANVKVAPDAPTGRHDVTIQYGSDTRKATSSITVSAGQIQQAIGAAAAQAPALTQQQPSLRALTEVAPQGPPQVQQPEGRSPIAPQPPSQIPPLVVQPLAGPTIDTIFPDQWVRGNAYNVTLKGVGLVQGMEVRFGDGVEAKGTLTVTTPTEAKIDIEVAKDAAAGERKVSLRMNANQPWIVTEVSAWVTVPSAKPVAEVQMPAPDLQNFTKGIIKLKEPDDYFAPGSYGFAMNDETVFRWEELNPGTAEWFEFRIVTEQGKVLMKKRIDPVNYTINGISYSIPPTYFRPDEAFLNEMLTSKFYLTDTTVANGLAGLLIYWEVGGFRSYTKKITVPGQTAQSKGGTSSQKPFVTVNTEVEISDRRALATPDKPTGLACQGSGKKGTNNSIQMVNIDLGKNMELGTVKTSNYTMDRWRISGEFTLDKSPYASHFESSPTPVNGMYSYQPPNIFIDWGDGTTEKIHLESKMKPPYTADYMLKIQSPLPEHAFSGTGNKTIRVFVLPESDTQSVNPNLVASSYDNLSGSTSSYFQILQMSGFNWKNANSGPSYADIGNRAYMVYCRQIAIDPRKDLVATGLLHLESVDITGYNGSGQEGKAGLSQALKTGIVGAEKGVKTMTNKGGPSLQASQAQKAGAGPAKGAAKVTTTKEAYVSADSAMAAINAAGAGSSGETILSKCDMMQGNALLTSYGKGKAVVTWTLLDREGGKNMVLQTVAMNVGPSPQRDMSKLGPEEAGKPSFPQSFGYTPLDSGILKMDQYTVGKRYLLRVDVHVGIAEIMALNQEQMMDMIQQMKPAGNMGGIKLSDMEDGNGWLWRPGQVYAANLQGTNKTFVAAAVQSKPASQANSYVNALAGSGMKVGILSPSKEHNGLPMVASVNSAVSAAAGASMEYPREKPYYVSSAPYIFRIAENSPGAACRFLFVTKSNDIFEISNLYGHTKGDGKGNYNGTGSLLLRLYKGAGSRYEKLVPVKIAGWRLKDDGVTVAQGAVIGEALGDKIQTNGLAIKLDRVDATALQTDMNLTLTVKPQDNTLRLPGGTEQPVWSNKQSRVTMDGDWFYQDNTEKEIAIGWSGFRLKTTSAALDLSSKQGHPVGTAVKGDGCGGSGGNEWAGIHLGNALVTPYLASLSSTVSYSKYATNWGIAEGGLCGNVDLGDFSTTIMGGTISIGSIHAAASGGNFNATYKNMTVKVPWVDVVLAGDAVLVDGAPGKDASLDFGALKGGTAKKDYGLINLEAGSFIFGNYKGVGWGVLGNAKLGFKAEETDFAKDVWIGNVIFGMDGIAYLVQEGQTSVQVPAGGKTSFGATPVDLVSVAVSGFGSMILDFSVATQFSVSEVLPVANVPVGFKLSKKSSSFTSDYAAQGPFVSPFNLKVSFPQGQPTVEAGLTLNYAGPGGGLAEGGGSGIAEGSQSQMYASAGPLIQGPYATDAQSGAPGPIMLASNGSSTEGDRFSGKVDMSMFGSPVPGTVEFRLGYKGGHDYWLMRATITQQMPILPPFLYAYQLRGGLGHNFAIDAFKNPSSISGATPAMDNSYLFMAGMQVGSPDGVLYMFDGEMVVQTGTGARMDYKAWILTADHSGAGTLHGYFQYAGGAFDGALTGKFSQLGDAVYVEIPEGAASVHFGNGSWHVYAGTKDGPRLQGHVLIFDANAYLMIGSEGLFAGAGQSKRFDAGNCDKVCAYVETYFDVNLGIALNPFKISGSFAEGASAGLCVWKIGCKGISINFNAYAELPPPYMYVSFHTSAVPCPVDSIDIGMRVIPPGGIDWDIDWCDCGIIDC